jgi:hypothetical protein
MALPTTPINPGNWADLNAILGNFTHGAAASVADGGTITHGFTSTPAVVLITGTVALNTVNVTAIGATTFTVSIKVSTTGAAGTTQTIYWAAYLA